MNFKLLSVGTFFLLINLNMQLICTIIILTCLLDGDNTIIFRIGVLCLVHTPSHKRQLDYMAEISISCSFKGIGTIIPNFWTFQNQVNNQRK